MTFKILDKAVGYSGYLTLQQSSDPDDYGTTGSAPKTPIAIPITSSGLTKNATIIEDESIHGDNTNAAVGRIAFSEGRYEFMGDIGMNLYNYPWTNGMLPAWLCNERAISATIVMTPDGSNFYTYEGCKVTEVTISGSEGNDNITITVGVLCKSQNKTQDESTDVRVPGTFSSIATTCSIINESPVPWWQSFVYKSFPHSDWCPTTPAWEDGNNASVLSWSVSINHGTFAIYGYSSVDSSGKLITNTDPRFPKHIKGGMMNVTGNLVLFGQDGINQPLDNQRIGRIGIQFGADMSTPIPGSTYKKFGRIAIPKVFITNYPYPVAGAGQRVTRTINFEGFSTYIGTTGYPPVILQSGEGLSPTYTGF